MSSPSFSVVIPSYNRAGYLPAALDSVFAQKHSDFEVIVVDDGSTDDTRQALEPYMDRICYLYQENRGSAAARNRGIREARGRWIAFLDSDDMWEPETLERIATAFRENPDVGLVALTAREIDENERITGRVHGKNTAGPCYTTKSLLWGDSGSASWFSVRREILDAVGPYDESLLSAEECDILLRISFHTRMMNLPEPLMRFRAHSTSLSQDRRTNARCWIRILEKLEERNPEWVQRNRRIYRRALGKELLRFGRETLAYGGNDPEALQEARATLGRSIRTFPAFRRAYLYWAWAWVAPSTFGSWRRRRMARRQIRSH